ELDYVGNQVDPSTGTLQVRGLLSNPRPEKGGPRLLTPGLFLRVRLPVGPPRRALVVPQAALGTDQGKKFLYVVDDKNVVEYRPVVAVAKPVERESADYEFRGRVEPSETVAVRAAVPGTVAEVRCEAGAAVKKGDVLFELEAGSLKKALAAARADLKKHEAAVE